MTVDAELLRNVSAETTLYTLTRPLAVIAYTALLAAAILNGIVLSIIGGSDEERARTLTWTLLAIIALIIASMFFTRASVRRAISTAMPSGTRISVVVGEDALRLASKRGVSEMPYSTFAGIRVGRHAAVLRLSGQSVVTAIPRVLLSDADIATLRAKI